MKVSPVSPPEGMASALDLLDALGVALAWLDGTGRLAACNQELEALAGSSGARLAGRPADDLLGGAPALGELAARSSRTGRRVTSPWVARPGSRPRRAEVAPYRGGVALALLPGSLAAGPDDPDLELLARGLAHEIRNPLGGVRGAAQLLEELVTSSEGREYLSLILAEVDRVDALIRRLGTLGQPLPPGDEAADLHRAAHAALAAEAAAAAADGAAALEAERRFDPSLPPVAGREEVLVAAIRNLLRNARQAGAGRVRLTSGWVLAAPVDGGRAVSLAVADDGCGFEPALAERLFEPFFTQRHGGTGLGLSEARRAIRALGGEVTAAPRSEGGACFTLYLPATGRRSAP